MNDRGKGVVNEESVVNGTTVSVGVWGISPIPREIVHQKQGSDSGSRNSARGVFGSWVDLGGMQKYLPKIKLITFDGKKPRVWVRKCIKHFEDYKAPSEEKVEITSLFFID